MWPASTGKKSTGTRSIKFINNIQTKTVRARGAIRVFLTEPNKDCTLSSTNSIHISTKFCIPVGAVFESVLFDIPFLNKKINNPPNKTDQNKEST